MSTDTPDSAHYTSQNSNANNAYGAITARLLNAEYERLAAKAAKTAKTAKAKSAAKGKGKASARAKSTAKAKAAA